MKLWCGAEVEKAVLTALTKTEVDLKSRLNSALGSDALADIDLELCYIPIVMSVDFSELYPPRSSFSKTENKAFHSPQLRFVVFERGTSLERERAYIEGLLLARPLLNIAGLNERQVVEFETNLHRLLTLIVN